MDDVLGSNPRAQMEGLDQLTGKANYFIGDDPDKWHTNIPLYSRVRHKDIYPGVSVVYYGNPRELEYDFVIEPGADPSAIRVGFEGVKKICLDSEGNLVLSSGDVEIRQRRPLVYQDANTRRQNVPADFVLQENQLSFRLGKYDKTKPLVIDPALDYSTYLGPGQYNGGGAIATDATGNVFVTGTSGSPDFLPTAGPFQKEPDPYSLNASVMKLNAQGSEILYYTLIGGTWSETIHSIKVNAGGFAYVAGETNSPDFPTVNPVQVSLHSSAPPYSSDAFAAKLDPTGSTLIYSTYLGGSDFDSAQSLAIDSGENAYVTGTSQSADYPVTPNGFQKIFGDGKPPTNLAFYSDAFVTKLNAAGNAFVYSSFLGGADYDVGFGIDVDSEGSAYVTGRGSSSNFPMSYGPFQSGIGQGLCDAAGCARAFIAKVNPSGSALVFSTLIEGGQGIRIAM